MTDSQASTPDPAPPRRSRWRAVGATIGLALLFAGLTALFAHLLRPLVAPPVTAVAEAPVAVATVEPTAPPVVSAPAAPTPVPAGPRIAILIAELGPNPVAARAAIADLPPAVGLSFSPYPKESHALAQAALRQGHEIWVSVPMQPKAYPRVSPGPNTLLVANAAPENQRRLDWALARVGGAVGITAMMGSAFTEDAQALRPVLGELVVRKLAFLDNRASVRSVAPAEARAAGVPTAGNDRFLDEDGSIEINLAALEAMARRNGTAIGFARALPASIAAIDAWAETLEAKGIRLVPPGTLVTTAAPSENAR